MILTIATRMGMILYSIIIIIRKIKVKMKVEKNKINKGIIDYKEEKWPHEWA